MYTSPTWVNVPPNTVPPPGAVALSAENMQELSDAVAALASGGVSGFKPVGPKTANYTAHAGEFVLWDTTSGSLVMTLPTAPPDQSSVGAKIVILGAGHTVTINCGGSDVFNKTGGGTSLVLSLVDQAYQLEYHSGVWVVTGIDLSLTQLDARYSATSVPLSRFQKTFNPREYGAVMDGATDDSAAVASCFTAMKVSGKATGTLLIDGPCFVSSGLVFDGGYTNVCGSDSAAGNERFRLVVAGEIKAASTVARAVSVQGFYGAEVDVTVTGGGRRQVTDAAITGAAATLTSATAAFTSADVGRPVMIRGAGPFGETFHATIASVTNGTTAVLNDNATTTVSGATCAIRTVGVHIENLVRLSARVRGENFLGTVLHGDATSDATKRVEGSTIESLYANQGCGQAIFFRWIEAFGTIQHVHDWGCVDDNYIGFGADTGIKHWEGFALTTQRNHILFESCNSGNHGSISVGDRSTDSLVTIMGTTTNPSDFGTVQEIRCSSDPTGAHVVPNGLKLLEVSSVEIDDVRTFRNALGVQILGGGQNGIKIGYHRSLTAEQTALQLGPSTQSSAPFVTVECDYRLMVNEAVKVLTGLTGGKLRLLGRIDTPNTGADGAKYGINVAGTSGPMILDISGLHMLNRTTLAGAITHPTPANIWGAKNANILNNYQHSVIAAATTPVSATDYQNTTGRTMNALLQVRSQPVNGTPTEIDVSLGATNGTETTVAWITRSIAPAVSGTGDFTDIITLRIPPWWWYTITKTGAVTINSLKYYLD